jgi:hypothetical protein
MTKKAKRYKKGIKKILAILNANQPKKLLTILSVALIAITLILIYFQNLKTHSFHIDEWGFVGKSYYFDLLFIKKDTKDPRWHQDFQEALVDAEQPKVGPYIYGLTLHLAGIPDIEKKFEAIEFGKLKENEIPWINLWWNQELKNLPQNLLPKIELIRTARFTSVLFSLGTFLLIGILGYKTKGLLFGILSTVLIATNSLMYTFGKRAMTDSIQLFFFFLNLTLVMIFLEALKGKDNQKITLLSLVLGINAALGVGVKISGILILFFLTILIFALLYLQTKQQKSPLPLLKSYFLIIISFLVVFVLLHPYLYHHTIKHFFSMFLNRLIASQDYMKGMPITAIYSRWEALTLIIRQTLSPTHGPYVNFRTGNFPLDFVLFVTGAWYLGEKALADFFSKEKISGELVLLIWSLVVIVSLVFYLQNNWARYYLPAETVITIIQAYAVATLVDALWPPTAKRLSRFLK